MSLEEYITTRYEPQILWYNKKANYNHRMYQLYQSTIIIGATVMPVLSANLVGQYRWISVVVSSLLAILIGLLNLFKYQEKWIRHRAFCEKLKRERFYLESGAQEYITLPEAEKLKRFVERVEQLIESEQSDWVKEHGKKEEVYRPGVR